MTVVVIYVVLVVTYELVNDGRDMIGGGGCGTFYELWWCGWCLVVVVVVVVRIE